LPGCFNISFRFCGWLIGFERKAINHDRKASNNLQFGDPVYSHDPLSFPENDDLLDNTILAVVNNIITMHSKPINGPGGSTQKIGLITRLFPKV